MNPGRYESPWMNEELRLYRSTVRHFVEETLVPQQERWMAQGHPDAEAWRAAGAHGLLLPDVSEAYGGGGGTAAYEAVVIEELARGGVRFATHVQTIVAHYVNAYASEERKRCWLPRMARGELVGAIAMTEPGAGSDLQRIATTARADGDEFVINGSKTFITNGHHAGLVCVLARTDPTSTGPRSSSLIMVETAGLRGYAVGRVLDKAGCHGQDTCELFFDDVRVPAANLLGPAPGRAAAQMMEQLSRERLAIALIAAATAERAVELTAAYTKERTAFGKPLFELQNTRFRLAECWTDAHVGRVFVDDCLERFLAGALDPVRAAMAKYWTTTAECRIADACLQLHGGYGYMTEFPISRIWTDSRWHRIGGGTDEIMKEVIGWGM